jgi:CheY-like chemotaxis protein
MSCQNELDILTAAEYIRGRWQDGQKIIAINTYSLEGDRDRCPNMGMEGYISKPMQKGELAEVLKRCTLEAQ